MIASFCLYVCVLGHTCKLMQRLLPMLTSTFMSVLVYHGMISKQCRVSLLNHTACRYLPYDSILVVDKLVLAVADTELVKVVDLPADGDSVLPVLLPQPLVQRAEVLEQRARVQRPLPGHPLHGLLPRHGRAQRHELGELLARLLAPCKRDGYL